MTKYRYDKDMYCIVEVRPNANYFEEEKPQSANVITDDIGAGVNGLRAMHRKDRRHFDSKSAFRADVRAAGLREVGNEQNFARMPDAAPKDQYHRIAQEAFQRFDGNHEGIADRVRAEERQTAWRRNNG